MAIIGSLNVGAVGRSIDGSVTLATTGILAFRAQLQLVSNATFVTRIRARLRFSIVVDIEVAVKIATGRSRVIPTFPGRIIDELVASFLTHAILTF